MENDNAFNEINIKYRASYYFDVIIDINDINLIKCYQMKNCKKRFCTKRKFKKRKKKKQKHKTKKKKKKKKIMKAKKK